MFERELLPIFPYNTLFISTDGAIDDQKYAGSAAVFHFSYPCYTKAEHIALHLPVGTWTNNRTELTAIGMAILAITKHPKIAQLVMAMSNKPKFNVVILTDFDYAKQMVDGNWHGQANKKLIKWVGRLQRLRHLSHQPLHH